MQQSSRRTSTTSSRKELRSNLWAVLGAVVALAAVCILADALSTFANYVAALLIVGAVYLIALLSRS
jgi:hypothetical protein